MSNIKISGLPAVIVPAGTDTLEIVQGGISKKETVNQILQATTLAYQAADTAIISNVSNLVITKAGLVSPAFSGTPTAPTAAANTNTTQIATTAFATTADVLRLRLSGADTMLGALNMGSNKINNLTDGTSAQDAISLLQMQTANILKAGTLETYDPTATSAFPTTWNSIAIKKGNRFYISVAGTMATGAVGVNIGDILEARINAATDAAADWSIIHSVPTTSAGLAAVISDETGSGALVFANTPTIITPNVTGAISLGTDVVGVTGVSHTFRSENATGATVSYPVFFKSGTTASAASGIVSISSGDVSTLGTSGNLFVSTGNSAISGGTGQIQIVTGSAVLGSSGSAFLRTGGVTTGNSGVLQLSTGNATTGNTGTISITTGIASTGNSGDIVFTTGTASAIGGIIFNRTGSVSKYQPAPTAMTGAATITPAAILGGIIVGTPTTGATRAYTLPTGVDLANALPANFTTSDSIDFSIINVQTVANTDTITLTASVGITIVGQPIIDYQVAGGNSTSRWRLRCTGVGAFVCYRIC